MNETRKMSAIRQASGYDAYFRGRGIDIGCGSDPLSSNDFHDIESVQLYDREHGNAQTCANLKSGTYDFVYSSHCLEHMDDPKLALENWIRICRRDGHIVFAVPHEVYYEKLQWPSRFNSDHKWSWRLEKTTSMPSSINAKEFAQQFPNIHLISARTYLEHFDWDQFWQDQTLGTAICQIEVILRKTYGL